MSATWPSSLLHTITVPSLHNHPDFLPSAKPDEGVDYKKRVSGYNLGMVCSAMGKQENAYPLAHQPEYGTLPLNAGDTA